jgi:hypothetical protein
MNIDERLERLKERHDALIQSLQLWAAERREREAREDREREARERQRHVHDFARDKELDAKLDRLEVTVESLLATIRHKERMNRVEDPPIG